MNIKWAEKLRKGLHGSADSLGNLCVEAFHYLALFGIGAITAYAAVVTFLDMLGKGGVSVDDILLLFIYLELGAMVGIYFKTNHMPIRFLLYVAITALTRLLIGDVSHHKAPDVGLLYVCGGILLLALFGLLGQTQLNAMNGLKNWVSALLTAIAVAIYAAGGLVLWQEALMMMVAATAGGYGGARLARKLPPAVLRSGIVVTGLAMSLVFFSRL